MRHGFRHGEHYYGGGAALAVGINPLSAALEGRSYEIDLKFQGGVQYSSVPLLRDQADQSAIPGKQSINPEAFWRRGTESWHLGAGQSVFDRDEALPYRFRTSKGINVWDRWQLSLLNDTHRRHTSANANLHMAVAGSYLYFCDGTALSYTQNVAPGGTSTTVTGTPANAPTSITSDGFAVYTAHGANGIYRTTRGAGSTASHVTGTVSLVAYVKDRLMAAATNNVYNITAAGALPAALYTQPNTDFTWVGFAAGDTHIYAAGFSGDKSLIYRTRIKDDGTGLDALVVGGELPDGEVVTSIYGYLGFVLIGSDKGIRFATSGSTGDLTIGALIPVGTGNVECFEGQDRFVWFGWPSFDATSSGLGRLDLQNFSDTEKLTPAYASDLMAASTGAVRSVVTFQNRRVFGLAGYGIVAEDISSLVSQGQLDTGKITFNLADPKVSLHAHLMATGSRELWISVDGAAFVQLGAQTGEQVPYLTGAARGMDFELRAVLKETGSTGAVVTAWGMHAQPTLDRTTLIVVPLLLAPEISKDDAFHPYDSYGAWDHIVELAASRDVVQWQLGQVTHPVIVEDYELHMHQAFKGDITEGINGTCLVKMKVVV